MWVRHKYALACEQVVYDTLMSSHCRTNDRTYSDDGNVQRGRIPRPSCQMKVGVARTKFPPCDGFEIFTIALYHRRHTCPSFSKTFIELAWECNEHNKAALRVNSILYAGYRGKSSYKEVGVNHDIVSAFVSH